MVSAKNLILAFVGSRFFLWHGRDIDKWIVYENLPEEGETTRKKIISFDDKAQAEKFFEEYKAEWVKYYKKRFGVKDKGNKSAFEHMVILELCLAKSERKPRKSKEEKAVEAVLGEPPSEHTPIDAPAVIPDTYDGVR